MTIGVELHTDHSSLVTIQDPPLGWSSDVVDGYRSNLSANSQSLSVVMEWHHGKRVDYLAQDQCHDLQTVLPQVDVIGIQALQQDLRDLNQMCLQWHATTSDIVLQHFQHAVLVLFSFSQSVGLTLYECQKLVRERLPDFIQTLTSCSLQIQFRIRGLDELEVKFIEFLRWE